ncbi:MAG TPA: HAD family hydrolase [Gemmatimonadaceae bacterium]|jgi:3-deoxy-D-manno-octulosonate 8-phosphate phosphatase (KDO 8-P phosphatase)|nr:HAD family hydrolase [Gemmatimonadaceae bacterium]
MIEGELARRIALVALDVDGVLTDGGIYLGAANGQPVELKRYDIQDGLGIHLLQRAGIRVAIITGRVSESVRLRAAELNIDDVAQDREAQKLPALEAMLDRHGLTMAEVAFVGDDFPDLAVLRRVGLAVAPADAVEEVRRECAVVLAQSGGRGAVREFAELLLKARGEWDAVWQAYVGERSGGAVPHGARR